MYNSPEERAMIHAVSGNEQVPGVVVGIGSDVPNNPQPARFRQKHKIRGPFAVYVGRIDQNKGCNELFEFFQGYLQGSGRQAVAGSDRQLAAAGARIIRASATSAFSTTPTSSTRWRPPIVLIMPSYYESLSMVALEAWALGRPVLANGKCDVLKGQCLRSNAGLYYETLGEFIGTLEAIEQNRWLAGTLGRNGRQFFREQYDWPVIERKYLEMFERLKKEPPRADRAIRCPAGSIGGARTCRRPKTCWPRCPRGPVGRRA